MILVLQIIKIFIVNFCTLYLHSVFIQPCQSFYILDYLLIVNLSIDKIFCLTKVSLILYDLLALMKFISMTNFILMYYVRYYIIGLCFFYCLMDSKRKHIFLNLYSLIFKLYRSVSSLQKCKMLLVNVESLPGRIVVYS